jgi:hypothetical protein
MENNNKENNKDVENNNTKQQQKKQIILKDDLIRLISAKSNYTIVDTKIFWESFISVLEDIVEEQIELSVSGFGRMVFHSHSPLMENGKIRQQWDNVHKVWYDDKFYRYITFDLSEKLKEIVRNSVKESKENKE